MYNLHVLASKPTDGSMPTDINLSQLKLYSSIARLTHWRKVYLCYLMEVLSHTNSTYKV